MTYGRTKVFHWSVWTDQSSSSLVFQQETVYIFASMCMSPSVCVDVCELLASFIPAAVCRNACVLFCRVCVRVVCLRLNRLCHLLPFPCACAHVDTLSLTALYVPTRGTPYPPQPLCVYRADTQYSPSRPPVHVCAERGTLSAFHRGETRHVFIPPPFPLIRPGAVHLTVV